MSDRALLERLVRGDPEAGRQVAQRVVPRCRRIVNAIVGDPTERDDIVQLCLVDVLRGAKGFRGDAALETWATRIAVRRTVKESQRRRREAEPIAGEIDAVELADQEQAARSLSESLPRPLPVYLDALPEVHREAIVLRYGLGYGVAEIAALTGTAANTIKVRLYQGLKKLRVQIDRDTRARGATS